MSPQENPHPTTTRRTLPSALPAALALSLLLLLLLGVVSCRSLVAPPGYASRGSGTAGRIEFPEGVSLEAQYVLLAWYESQHGEEARRRAGDAYGVVVNALRDRGALLRGMAARELAERYPAFAYVPPNGGLAFLYGALGARQDYGQALAMLAECRRVLESQRTLEVPLQECAAYLEQSASAQEAARFRQWASGHSRLEIASSDQESLRLLEACRRALVLKQRLAAGAAEAEECLQGDALGAPRILRDLDEADQAILPEALAELNLIEDQETLPQWKSLRSNFPARVVSRVAARVEGLSLSEGEALLSNALREWEGEVRLAAASQAARESLATVREGLFRRRVHELRQESQRAEETGGYAGAIQRVRQRLASLEKGDFGDWECYRRQGMLEELSELLRTQSEALLEGARKHYLARQRELLDSGHPALALEIGELLSSLLGEAPLESAEAEQRAKAALREESALYTLQLGAIAAGDPGLGASWRGDLEVALAKALSEGGWNALLGLSSSSQKDALPNAWRLEQCELLEHDGGQVETARSEEIRLGYGEPTLEETGEHAFVQRQWSQRVERIASTRVGHLRIRGRLARGDESRVVECNAFYPQTFLQETVLSENSDAARYRCQDQRELKTVTAPPALQKDRVWSQGEMMDFARRQGLSEFASGLLGAFLEESCRQQIDRISCMGEDSWRNLGTLEESARLLHALKRLSFPTDSPLEQIRLLLLPKLQCAIAAQLR